VKKGSRNSKEGIEIDRRQLLQGSLAVAGFAGFCCTTPEIPAGSFSFEGGMLVISLRKAPVLAKPGGSAKVIDLDRQVNLIVVHHEKNRFAALDRSCTHGGAQVVYNPHRRTVQCTSWGHSEFGLEGAVLGGSAKEPLCAYPARCQGERLEIVLSADQR
jgi:Rieske Fe-S protein